MLRVSSLVAMLLPVWFVADSLSLFDNRVSMLLALQKMQGWPYCGRPKEKAFLYEV